MVCRCKHEFCYLCQARWKTCACVRSNEATVWPGAAAEGNAAPAANAPLVHIHGWVRRHQNKGHTAPCQACQADWLPWLFHCVNCGRVSCMQCR
ncbi:hypothetical protein PMIN03_005512 [Paraphaeosphaeria minitans]